MYEAAVARRRFPTQQRRITGKAHRFLRDAAPAEVRLAIAIVIGEQLEGILAWRHIDQSQRYAGTAGHAKCWLPGRRICCLQCHV